MITSERRQNWVQLASVQAGGAICLPMFIIGDTLTRTYGFGSAILAIFAGNLLLLLLGSVTAWASAEDRKSTAEYATELFGDKRNVLFAGAMVLSMMGWYAIQLNIMTLSIEGILGISLGVIGNLMLGTLITLVGIQGMRGLTFLANLSMPLLVLTIGYAIYAVSGKEFAAEANQSVSISGISLILASAIGAVIDLPTFFREAKSKKDSVLGAVVLFALVLPSIELVGVYLFTHSQGKDIVEVLMGSSNSKLWMIWVLSFLLLAGWTTNNANLYSASVSMKVVAPSLTERTRMIGIGLVGASLSCFNFLDHIIVVLDVIGILLGSMGAVLIVHFLSRKGSTINGNFFAWTLGLASGFASQIGFGLTDLPVLDAFLIAFLGMGYTYLKIPIINKEELI